MFHVGQSQKQVISCSPIMLRKVAINCSPIFSRVHVREHEPRVGVAVGRRPTAVSTTKFKKKKKKMKSVDFCVQGIAAGLPLRLRPDLMLPNNCHCPLSTGGRQITMPMHRYKTQIESPEAKCPRFALIRCRMRSRALRKLQTHRIAPKGHRNG